MSMYENLQKLHMTGNPMTKTPELTQWTLDEASKLGLQDTPICAAAISLGFVYGVAYAMEFGIPDCSKNLITIKENVDQ
ncbi:hypothetical protein LCGC14_0316050 [marine sediment metagenome]|uniref:Uncharacterized protein n=1 Tax=marine sediment metagenome TaxID=412755 RepID=A0A0F9WSB8_9ZZZZ